MSDSAAGRGTSPKVYGGPKKGRLNKRTEQTSLLAAGVFGDSLGSLADGVLGELTRQKQPHGSLDLSGCDGASLVVVSQSRSFSGDSLEDIVHEAVHDRHGLAGHTGVGVHLLQHFVDVDGVGFPPPPLAFLVGGTGGLGLGGRFLRAFRGNSLCWHVDCFFTMQIGNTPHGGFLAFMLREPA